MLYLLIFKIFSIDFEEISNKDTRLIEFNKNNIWIHSCKFENFLINDDGGSIFISNLLIFLFLEKTQFINISSLNVGGCIYLRSNLFNISQISCSKCISFNNAHFIYSITNISFKSNFKDSSITYCQNSNTNDVIVSDGGEKCFSNLNITNNLVFLGSSIYFGISFNSILKYSNILNNKAIEYSCLCFLNLGFINFTNIFNNEQNNLSTSGLIIGNLTIFNCIIKENLGLLFSGGHKKLINCKIDKINGNDYEIINLIQPKNYNYYYLILIILLIILIIIIFFYYKKKTSEVESNLNFKLL